MRAALVFLVLISAWAPRAQAETGVTEKEILIGSCAPLSGVNADLGRNEVAGASAYVDYLNNEKGGVHGRKIRLISYDDKFEPEEAILCFNRLMRDGVFAGAFFVGSPTAAKYVGMAESNKIPLVGVISGGKFLYEPFKRYIFGMRVTFQEETSVEAEHLWNDLGVRRIGAIYQSDALGAAGLEGVNSFLKRHHAEPAALASISRNSLDVEAAVKRMEAAKPEAVFLLLTYGAAAEIAKKIDAGQWHPLFILLAGRDAYLEAAGKAAEGTVWALLFPKPDDIHQAAIALFRKLIRKYSPETTAGSKPLEGFIHAMILAEGLKKAGRNLTREKLVDAIESVNSGDLGFNAAFKLRFSPADHQGFKTVHFVVVRNGKPVPFSDWKELKTGIAH